MMRILKNAGYFALLTVMFSCIYGCGGAASSNTGPAVESQPIAEAPVNAEPAKKSEYPPIASAVANADIKSLDGTMFKVADKKGKVLLLNLWATWCGPCRAEMPALVRMQERHGADQLEIIGLNTDDEPIDQINAFAEKMDLNYHLAWAETSLQSSLLKISKYPGIPQSFLIDRDGNLRGVFRGANPVDVRKMEVVVAKVVKGEDMAPEPEAAASPAAADAVPIEEKPDEPIKPLKKGPKP